MTHTWQITFKSQKIKIDIFRFKDQWLGGKRLCLAKKSLNLLLKNNLAKYIFNNGWITIIVVRKIRDENLKKIIIITINDDDN